MPPVSRKRVQRAAEMERSVEEAAQEDAGIRETPESVVVET